ncbi:protein of unknown function DUF155 - like 1 [Theobroma cacao]|nr:protein of unknown function DUF155 - like 1 [Theobroma cacao]
MWRSIRQLPSFSVRTARTQALPYPSFLSFSASLPKPQSSSSFYFFTPAKTLPATATSSPTTIILWTFNGSRGGGNATRGVPARCLSSIPTPQPETMVDWNDAVSCSEVGDGGDNDNGRTLEEDTKRSIPVRAYFFSTSVDLRRLVEQNKQNFIPPTSRMTNYVVLKFGNLASSPKQTNSFLFKPCTSSPFLDFFEFSKDENQGPSAFISGSDSCFMVVFQYGSIVLFNVREHEVDEYLKIVEKHASGLLPEMRKDEYEVREKPSLNTWMQGGLDYIMLQFLNIDGIRTIGSVLGQSIALDYYVRQVDGMVGEFTDINRGMEKTGTFTMDSKKLFQIVGKANSNLADVILKLGLFERSDIAWKDAKYAQIWEFLRDEFELTQRFASLDFKLKFVEHNIRFLQEILQNRKSDFLEWLIIVLISTEIVISLYDLIKRSL